MRLLALILIMSLPLSIKEFRVNCDNGNMVKSGQHLIIKNLVFESDVLPMSYNSKIEVYNVEGFGQIISPSSVTSRRPKNGEQEPIVIFRGDSPSFEAVKIGEFVVVEYD